MQRWRTFIPIIVLAVLGIALFFSGMLDRFRPENLAAEQVALQAQIGQHPVVSALAYIGVIAFVIATGIPVGGAVLIITGGMLFGIVLGTILGGTGVTLGALVLFLASRHAFGDHTHAHAPGLVGRLRGGYHAHPVSYTFFLRLVPFFPFGGVTVALAWLRCPLWLFVAATGGGGTVMVAAETALGAGLAKTIGQTRTVSLDLLSHPGVLVPLLAISVLSLVPVVVAKWRARMRRPPQD